MLEQINTSVAILFLKIFQTLLHALCSQALLLQRNKRSMLTLTSLVGSARAIFSISSESLINSSISPTSVSLPTNRQNQPSAQKIIMQTFDRYLEIYSCHMCITQLQLHSRIRAPGDTVIVHYQMESGQKTI